MLRNVGHPLWAAAKLARAAPLAIRFRVRSTRLSTRRARRSTALARPARLSVSNLPVGALLIPIGPNSDRPPRLPTFDGAQVAPSKVEGYKRGLHSHWPAKGPRPRVRSAALGPLRSPSGDRAKRHTTPFGGVQRCLTTNSRPARSSTRGPLAVRWNTNESRRESGRPIFVWTDGHQQRPDGQVTGRQSRGTASANPGRVAS